MTAAHKTIKHYSWTSNNLPNIKELRVGQRIKPRWDGYPGCPMHITQDWATITRIGRTRVTVETPVAAGEFSLSMSQIGSVEMDSKDDS